MKKTVLKITLAGILTALLSVSTSAQEMLTWNWVLTNPGNSNYNASGTLTTEATSSTANGYTGYLITDISGIAGGETITSLLNPGTIINGANGIGSDNLLGDAMPQLDANGVSFTTSAGQFNISYSDDYSYMEIIPAGTLFEYNDFAAAPVSSTPEPAGLVLAGLSALGLFYFRHCR